MPEKVKKATEQEGTTSDGDENVSVDDGERLDVESLSIRRDLTSTMPASEPGDLRPPASPDISTAVFSTSKVVREERQFTPAFQSNIPPSLQEQFDRALHEERFGDLSGIKDAMRAGHGGVQQKLALAIKEERWLDSAHFCEVRDRSVEAQMPPPQRLPQCIQTERQLTDESIKIE
jgi:hypothetical protein